jgi:hypothetical protein
MGFFGGSEQGDEHEAAAARIPLTSVELTPVTGASRVDVTPPAEFLDEITQGTAGV